MWVPSPLLGVILGSRHSVWRRNIDPNQDDKDPFCLSISLQERHQQTKNHSASWSQSPRFSSSRLTYTEPKMLEEYGMNFCPDCLFIGMASPNPVLTNAYSTAMALCYSSLWTILSVSARILLTRNSLKPNSRKVLRLPLKAVLQIVLKSISPDNQKLHWIDTTPIDWFHSQRPWFHQWQDEENLLQEDPS